MLDNNDIFIDMTTDEESLLRAEFSREIDQLLNVAKSHRPMQIYEILGVSRQTGSKYIKGQIPTKRPKELRRLLLDAVSKLKLNLTYRNAKLTPDILERRPDEERQLDLFKHDGFRFEISRKKSAQAITLQVRIREA